tara:strand:+ start:187 stop:447 length:261 start_codon:yes stop_codon:yes gene_type:complete
MKTNRNESCHCGSGNKYKNCCENKRFKEDGNVVVKWFVIFGIIILLVISMWGLFDSFSTDNPEMEAYKCDNPQCRKIHYRQKTDLE